MPFLLTFLPFLLFSTLVTICFKMCFINKLDLTLITNLFLISIFIGSYLVTDLSHQLSVWLRNLEHVERFAFLVSKFRSLTQCVSMNDCENWFGLWWVLSRELQPFLNQDHIITKVGFSITRLVSLLQAYLGNYLFFYHSGDINIIWELYI